MFNRVACDLSYQPGWILRLDLNIMIKVLLYLRSKNVC